jgi:GntR family transcriptional repressor for pyruvate dehydrogenase complex
MTEAVAERLLALLSSGQLKPGDRLPPERELARRLNVGRTTVREALKLLTLSGLLEAKRGQGTFVGHNFSESLADQIEWSMLLSQRDFENLFEVRRALEVLAARLAAERAHPADKAAIEVTCDLLTVDTEDAASHVEVDLAFHQAIARASHNELLERLMFSMHGFLRGYILRSNEATESPLSTLQEHEAVCQAIQAGDPDDAEQAMREHLAISFGLVMEALRRSEDPPMDSGGWDEDSEGWSRTASESGSSTAYSIKAKGSAPGSEATSEH